MNDFIPTTNAEAVRMLNRAFWHLRNRGITETWKARAVISDALNLLLNEMYREVA